MSHTSLSWMTDAELVRHHRSSWDSLTGTEAEVELADRLDERVLEGLRHQLFVNNAHHNGINEENICTLGAALIGDVTNTVVLLERLEEAGIRNKAQLEELLELQFTT